MHNKITLLKFKKFMPNLFIMLTYGYLFYFMINGSSGFLNMIKLSNELNNLKQKHNHIENEKIALRIKSNGLYVNSIDLDILEEESKKFGYLNKDEIVVLFDGE